MFEYKSDQLAGFEEISSIPKRGYSIRKIFFESPYKGRVFSYLIAPHTPGKHPAVIFLHPGQGIRETFLMEAELLAKKGIVSLVLDVPCIQGEFTRNLSIIQPIAKTMESLVDIEQYIQIIMNIRRAVDLLSSNENVDEKKIAYVGHGFGAAWGGVLAGIDIRIKAFVLISGYARMSNWYLTSENPEAEFIRTFLPPERFDHFILNIKRLDAVNYIKNAAPASIYFQYARDDEFINHKQADEYYSAASFPKKLSTYKTDHLFSNCDEALHDRHEWLYEQLLAEKDKILKESSST